MLRSVVTLAKHAHETGDSLPEHEDNVGITYVLQVVAAPVGAAASTSRIPPPPHRKAPVPSGAVPSAPTNASGSVTVAMVPSVGGGDDGRGNGGRTRLHAPSREHLKDDGAEADSRVRGRKSRSSGGVSRITLTTSSRKAVESTTTASSAPSSAPPSPATTVSLRSRDGGGSTSSPGASRAGFSPRTGMAVGGGRRSVGSKRAVAAVLQGELNSPY